MEWPEHFPAQVDSDVTHFVERLGAAAQPISHVNAYGAPHHSRNANGACEPVHRPLLEVIRAVRIVQALPELAVLRGVQGIGLRAQIGVGNRPEAIERLVYDVKDGGTEGVDGEEDDGGKGQPARSRLAR